MAWYESGPFDVSAMTARSLRGLKRGESWDAAGRRVWEESAEGSDAGNGSVMRCPPLAVAYADDPDRPVEVSRDSSRITHADPRCAWGAAVVNLAVANLLTREPRPPSAALDRVRDDAPDELVAALDPVAEGEESDDLPTSGYVVHTLRTALYDGLRAESPEEAVVRTVNRGGDTDTVGAVTGAGAGARFGADALLDRWVGALDDRERLARRTRRVTPRGPLPASTTLGGTEVRSGYVNVRASCRYSRSNTLYR